MKQEETAPGILPGGVMQVNAAQTGMPMSVGVIDNIGLGMPIIIPGANQQLPTSVPMDTNAAPVVQPVVHQSIPGPSNHEQLTQSQTESSNRQEDEEETSEEEDNSDDDCDVDDGELKSKLHYVYLSSLKYRCDILLHFPRNRSAGQRGERGRPWQQ